MYDTPYATNCNLLKTFIIFIVGGKVPPHGGKVPPD